MKALSLWQPYSSLLAAGLKQVETRGHPIHHTGRVYIHATKLSPRWCVSFAHSDDFRRSCRAAGWKDGAIETFIDNMPRGVIVGHVEFVACYPVSQVGRMDATPYFSYRTYHDPRELMNKGKKLYVSDDERVFGDYGEHRYAILTANPVLFDRPVPCVGRQSLFNIPSEVQKELPS